MKIYVQNSSQLLSKFHFYMLFSY